MRTRTEISIFIKNFVLLMKKANKGEHVFKKRDILKFVRDEFAKYGVHELNIKRIIIRIFRLHIGFNCKIKKERKYERK